MTQNSQERCELLGMETDEPAMAQTSLGTTAFELDARVPNRRCMDSAPRPSIAERGKTIVVALSPSTYWEKELHYVSKFLIRSSRDRVVLLYFSGAKGEDKMQALLASAKRRLAARSRLAERDIETEVRPLSRHSTHSSIAQYCKEVQADILVLGAERHDHHHGFFKFHRHDHVEEHCRQALASTKVVHVEAPSLDPASRRDKTESERDHHHL
ncbi:hypothetical protein QBZ16_003451 [Prototheca wickerhamii]|uniref:Uncharacterized protein n=1 Tax=Prototheca wickerhamii TaxID=3111 RepID=A0AAD9IJ07_PROWI|nr:hypothetical protein QBZ16_003451 [Prototheca wickerhamii]